MYERTTSEYKMIIDCKNNIGSFIFNNNEEYSFDILSKFTSQKDSIKIEYELGEDKKTIILKRKEE